MTARDFRAAADDAEADLPLGTHELTKGDHTIAFRAAAKPEQLGPLAVEMLRLLATAARGETRSPHPPRGPLHPPGHRPCPLRVPPGLRRRCPIRSKRWSAPGIMPARYLRDENNLPLRARREGDYFVVESPGKDGWQHRWQGLDARR